MKSDQYVIVHSLFFVAPFAGAWIEIKMGTDPQDKAIVAPFAGAWIEMKIQEHQMDKNEMSLPSRERGLKCKTAPLSHRLDQSLPSRERGLKLPPAQGLFFRCKVAPFAGAWIEITPESDQ